MDEFGSMLRDCRVAAGISMSELSRQINYSKAHISKIENGRKRANHMFAKLCDRVLDTDGRLAAAVPPTAPEAVPDKAAAPDDVWVLELDEGSLRFSELPRRQVLAGAGALGHVVTRTARPAIDDQTFSALRATFDQLRLLGTMTSPLMVLAQVIALVHTLRTLAADTPEPTCSELLLLAARATEFAGWMSQEAGDDAGAARWTDQAARLADGRDPHIATFALFRHAEIAMYRDDATQTIKLARHAQKDTAAEPRILGLAARCEAQGHALAADPCAFEEAMERAAAFFAVPQRTPGPVLGSESVPDELALARGWALYDLGRPGLAAELLDGHLPTIPTSARRARARFGFRRALAHAMAGAVDHACAAASEVFEDAAQVDSATIRRDIRQLSRALGRFHTHREAGDLRHRLVTQLL